MEPIVAERRTGDKGPLRGGAHGWRHAAGLRPTGPCGSPFCLRARSALNDCTAAGALQPRLRQAHVAVHRRKVAIARQVVEEGSGGFASPLQSPLELPVRFGIGVGSAVRLTRSSALQLEAQSIERLRKISECNVAPSPVMELQGRADGQYDHERVVALGDGSERADDGARRRLLTRFGYAKSVRESSHCCRSHPL